MKQKGFTLIEMVVVLAVVAILAAILVPVISKNITDANISRAQNETQVIAAAISSFYKDLGRWPTSDGTSGNPDVHYLIYSQGADTAQGADNEWNQAHLDSSDTMEHHLVTNQPGSDGRPGTNTYPLTGRWRWRGPYIAEIPSDPFGIHYSCNVRYLYTDPSAGPAAVYVLSAGPNRNWDTQFEQAPLPGTIAGDDIGTPLK